MVADFQEIAHAGGKLTITKSVDERGHISYGIKYEHQRNNACTIVALWVLPDGRPIRMSPMHGIGAPLDERPTPDSIQVWIASDSTGCFGHHCPRCGGYWRSKSLAAVCAYCGLQGQDVTFLSNAQRRYIALFCVTFFDLIESDTADSAEIDMDAVADAAGLDVERPSFYVSEKSQQCKFDCKYCGAFNDILGRFGYCSGCGTRNDLGEFRDVDVPRMRARLNANDSPEKCVQEGVSAFDSLVSKYARQLAKLVPMTKRRRVKLETMSFHDLAEVVRIFREWFDIDLRDDMRDADFERAVRMFLRRHVYEHNGGEVSQTYLEKSGDTTVCLKQHIHEEMADVHEFLGSLLKLAGNLHNGFHELFPPRQEPIRDFKEQEKRLLKARSAK